VTHTPSANDSSSPHHRDATRPPRRARPRRLITATIAVGAVLALTACGDEGGGPGGTQSTAAAATATQDGTVVGAGAANTAEVVAAAEAFLATLSDDQRETATYDFEDAAKTNGWSNFPTSVAERAGLALGDMDADQQAAALAVMEAALSEQGYTRLQDIRTADAYLAEDGGDNFSADEYYIAFYGEPSGTGEFTLQFGGHHLAYNLTYAGDDVSLSPTLTAIEPIEFTYEGEDYAPLADAQTATFAAIGSLSDDQLAAAELGDNYDDLLLGPQNDGSFPEPEGVLVSELSQEGQDAVTAMLRAWVGDIDEEAAEALVAQYAAEYDQTYIGWAGATGIDDGESYIRIDGPSAWIEFSNQPIRDADGVHIHSIFRDQTADYGG
jgi:Protein of unknown function (DUF3500)